MYLPSSPARCCSKYWCIEDLCALFVLFLFQRLMLCRYTNCVLDNGRSANVMLLLYAYNCISKVTWIRYVFVMFRKFHFNPSAFVLFRKMFFFLCKTMVMYFKSYKYKIERLLYTFFTWHCSKWWWFLEKQCQTAGVKAL